MKSPLVTLIVDTYGYYLKPLSLEDWAARRWIRIDLALDQRDVCFCFRENFNDRPKTAGGHSRIHDRGFAGHKRAALLVYVPTSEHIDNVNCAKNSLTANVL